MNRRDRKRKAAFRLPRPDIVAQLNEFILTHKHFELSEDQRKVIFTPTGKRFWIWDMDGIRHFVAGKTYANLTTHAASVPEVPFVDKSSVHIPTICVRVPQLVADRTTSIGWALYNQAVLSSRCGFSFSTLASAVYRCRHKLPEGTFDALLSLAKEANLAKHCHLMEEVYDELPLCSLVHKHPPVPTADVRDTDEESGEPAASPIGDILLPSTLPIQRMGVHHVAIDPEAIHPSRGPKRSRRAATCSTSTSKKKKRVPMVVYLPIFVRDAPVLHQQKDGVWIVDNSFLRSDKQGIAFRLTKDIEDRHPTEVAAFGDTVEGDDDGDGWLSTKLMIKQICMG